MTLSCHRRMKGRKSNEKTDFVFSADDVRGADAGAQHGFGGGGTVRGVDIGGGDHLFPENKPKGWLGI